MKLAIEALMPLVMTCAPQVHHETALRIITHESGGNPYAIGINGPYRVSPQPTSKEQAVSTANMLLQAGMNIDLGLAMINIKNLHGLGLSVQDVFDPCKNLGAMQKILGDSYAKAVSKHGQDKDGQARALVEALSAYNTGHPTAGVRNGYVAAVIRTQVPSSALTHKK